MSGIITLIPGDTDPRPEIVNGNERSEENNRSHMNPGQPRSVLVTSWRGQNTIISCHRPLPRVHSECLELVKTV